MLDYPLLSKTATKEKKTTAILDELFKLAQTSYPEFSRFSVALSTSRGTWCNIKNLNVLEELMTAART